MPSYDTMACPEQLAADACTAVWMRPSQILYTFSISPGLVLERDPAVISRRSDCTFLTISCEQASFGRNYPQSHESISRRTDRAYLAGKQHIPRTVYKARIASPVF
jgi:hypothetical protein